MTTPLDCTVTLGPVELRSPLIAACGTFGSVVEFADVAPVEVYGAAVAKSVSRDPWEGRRPPRLAPAGDGMLNAIGIQNPGIDAWAQKYGPRLTDLGVPVWGSAVGHSVEEFATVARGLDAAGVAAVEVNLSCPNLEGESMFALDPKASASVIAAVRDATPLPVGAKLSPNAVDIVAVADAVMTAGADWVVLTNTVWGAGIDVATRRPLLSSVVGGYSGAPIKPIALRCVWEVAQALPEAPIVGCGGVTTGDDVAEYLLAGASAVALGTVHFADPGAGGRIYEEVVALTRRAGMDAVADWIGGAEPW